MNYMLATISLAYKKTRSSLSTQPLKHIETTLQSYISMSKVFIKSNSDRRFEKNQIYVCIQKKLNVVSTKSLNLMNNA